MFYVINNILSLLIFNGNLLMKSSILLTKNQNKDIMKKELRQKSKILDKNICF